MDDVIYRQDAIDACCFGITHARAINVVTGECIDLFEASNKELHKAIERIEALPTAESQRKAGKWITVKGRLGNEVECDKCGSVFWFWIANYKFCPSCGSRMEG